MSETPWLTELATTAALTVCLVMSELRERGFWARMFSLDGSLTRLAVRCFAVFALWSAASAFWAASPYLVVHHALLWGEYILFFLYFRAALARSGDHTPVTYIFGIVAGVLGVLCIIEYVTLPDFKALEGVIRFRYGAYSELLVTVTPLLAALGLCASRTKGRVMLFGAATLGWLTIMLSLSKGAFIAGLAGFAITFAGIVVFSREYRRRAAIAAGAWLALTIAVQAGFSLLLPVPATVDYISGKADATRETSMARVFVWKIGLRMAREHSIIGVGADNFGNSFNAARERYRKDHPADPPDEPVSDNLIERGHNELIQIAAELGAIGLILFAFPFLMIGWALTRRFFSDRGSFSPALWASLGGIAAFFISSMVSSFSLRIAQNGIAFFIVLAVLINELGKLEEDAADAPERNRTPVYAAVPAFLALALFVWATKGYAEYCVLQGDREPDLQASAELYTRAVKFDPGYATADLRSAGRYYQASDFAAAAASLRKAIDHGCGVVLTYSALATSYEKAGDTAGAELSFDEALRIFPRSVFLHVRYARLLTSIGRGDQAERQTAAAREIDTRQADGWNNLLTIGSTRAFYAAKDDPALAAPADLKPAAAVLEYLDKPLSETPQ